MSMRWLLVRVLSLLCLAVASSAQENIIPLDRCDVLPILPVRVNGKEMRFLLDTGATTILNLNSFAGGTMKDIKVSSWVGTAATSAREVTLSELAIGNRQLRGLSFPAVDLSPIGKACGGQIDGLLGVDVLEKTGITIDFQRRQVQFHSSKATTSYKTAMMECVQAFNLGREEELKKCLDPQIVFYTPWGEYRGRDQVIGYLSRRFFSLEPRPKITINPHDSHLLGDAILQSYDYRVVGSGIQIDGRGTMVLRENAGSWQLLQMHNSIR
jgi:hypothetical protein